MRLSVLQRGLRRYGYWYSRDPDDISTTLSRLVGQVDNMQKVIAGLNRILQEVQDEQKEN